MSVPTQIERYLASHYADYEVVVHARTDNALETMAATYLTPRQLYHAVPLLDRRGPVVVALPCSHALNVSALNSQLRRALAPMAAEEAARLFDDPTAALTPVLSATYGVPTVIDTRLTSSEVFFEVSRTAVMRMSWKEFCRLQHCWHCEGIAQPRENAPPGAAVHVRRAQDSRQRAADLDSLPAMPEMAQRILQLRADPYADSDALTRVVALDPSLCAQLLHYARSPFFGYRGDVDSIQQAIARVLGYDMSMSISLGIALGGTLRLPSGGPLSLSHFWTHAVYAASLTQLLGQSLPVALRPNSGLAYLAGMLHHIGVLAFGHLFEAEFYWLNKTLEAEPQRPLAALEMETFGTDHMRLGEMLLRHWNLPPEVIAAARYHHQPGYDGLHACYPRLVFLANALLQRLGVGDATSSSLPSAQFHQQLGTSPQAVEQVFSAFDAARQGLDPIVSRLAA